MVEGILTEKQAGYEDLITRFGPRVITRGIVARKLPARYHSWRRRRSRWLETRNARKYEKKRFSSLYTVSNGRDRKAGRRMMAKPGLKRETRTQRTARRGGSQSGFKWGTRGGVCATTSGNAANTAVRSIYPF